jgi:hypothetical protein
LPGTHVSPLAPWQQMSAALEQAVATAVQALVTHFMLAVSQIVDGPYVASL